MQTVWKRLSLSGDKSRKLRSAMFEHSGAGCADIVEALHQKGALVHPLLDRAEGMLDHLAPPVENFRSRFQSRHHAVEHRLVFQTRDLAIVLGAARLDRANETRRPIAESIFVSSRSLLS